MTKSKEVAILQTNVRHNGVYYPEGTCFDSDHVHYEGLQRFFEFGFVRPDVAILTGKQIPTQPDGYSSTAKKHRGMSRVKSTAEKRKENEVEFEEVGSELKQAEVEKGPKQTHASLPQTDEDDDDAQNQSSADDQDPGEPVNPPADDDQVPTSEFLPAYDDITVPKITKQLEKLGANYDKRAKKAALYRLLDMTMRKQSQAQ